MEGVGERGEGDGKENGECLFNVCDTIWVMEMMSHKSVKRSLDQRVVQG